MCDLDFCDRLAVVKGLCRAHYHQRWRGEEFRPVGAQRVRPCQVESCERIVEAKGLCRSHYQVSNFYDLDPDEVAKLPDSCAGCGAVKDLHSDHDHRSGQFRGVLCRGCNVALGWLDDDPARLRALAAYLEKGYPRNSPKK
jgi:hypothetical protein